jgi:hypothetical protein
MSKEREVGMKKCLKTKEMSRQKVSKEAVLTGNKKTGAKRKPCQENEMCREENVKRRRSQGKKMPKDKDAKGKRRQRKAAETTSVSRDSNDIRKNLSGEKSVSSLWLQSCRQEGLSRFRNVRSKPDQEKVAASGKDVERKKCQGQRIPRDHGANGFDNQAVRLRSYKLSLFFIGFPPFRNFRRPACQTIHFQDLHVWNPQ